MSIYDHRDRPAYRNLDTPLQYADNEYILKWWTNHHDNEIAKQISIFAWSWYWTISDVLIEITAPEILETWKKKDPLCSRYAWYNILMNFAVARAMQKGLIKKIRKPQWKTCPLCNNKFIENSLPFPLIQRLGANKIDFCSPCLKDICFPNTGNDLMAEADIITFVNLLTTKLEMIPPQGFGEGAIDLVDLEDPQRLEVLKILRNKPSVKRIKEVFGSWLNALIKSGVLEDDTRRTVYGIQCLANDGHVCLSLGEKTIDDFLFKFGIKHEKEPGYPEGKYRADFLVNGVFIEYFGLQGNTEYDQKTELKMRICKRNNIKLIAIYPKDLSSTKVLARKISEALDFNIQIPNI